MNELLKRKDVAVALGIIVVVAFFATPSILKRIQELRQENTLRNSVGAFNRNDFDGAVRGADALLSKDPNNVSALIQKAAALAQEGSLTFKEKEYGEQAITLLQQALKLDPKNDEAWRIMGYANEIMQRYSEAHRDYETALTLNPRNVLAVSQNAHAYDLEGDFKKAKEGYGQALAMDPDLDQANMGLARISLRENDVKRALQYYRHVLDVSANFRTRAEAAYSASSLTAALGDHKAAAELARQATRYDPNYALGWVGYGREVFLTAVSTTTDLTTAERNKMLDESFNSLKKAIDINPGQSMAHVQLAAQFAAIGEKKSATMILSQVKKMIPNDITLSAPDKKLLLRQVEEIETLIK